MKEEYFRVHSIMHECNGPEVTITGLQIKMTGIEAMKKCTIALVEGRLA